MKFNTSISALMQFVNGWHALEAGLNKKDLSDFLKILSPFAPHLSEELWQTVKIKGLCCSQKWPKFNEELIEKKRVLLIVQINGKLRDKIEVRVGISQKEAEKLILKSEKINNLVNNVKIKKIVFIPDKLINFVI